MKNVILLLLIFPFFVKAQSPKSKLIAIDFVFSPDGYIKTNPLVGGPSIGQKSAYRFGINVVKDFNPNSPFSFRTGIRYCVYNQLVTGGYTDFITNKTVRDTSVFSLQYFQIPLALRYSIGKKKWRGYGEFVTDLNFKSNFSNLPNNINIGFSIGLEYSIKPTFALFAQPTMHTTTIENYYYNAILSLETGVKYRFNSL